jgi:hypothetical protein
VHSGNVNDSYLGSGKYLVSAISKYGKENFSRKILHVTKSLEDAYEIEKINSF